MSDGLAAAAAAAADLRDGQDDLLADLGGWTVGPVDEDRRERAARQWDERNAWEFRLQDGRRTGSVPVQLLDGRTAVKTVNMGNFQHIVTTYLSRYGVHPDYRYEFSNQFLSISLAENNQALCFCHRSLVKENLSSRTFCLEPPLRYHHYFCTRAGEPLSAQAQRFRSHLLSRS